MASAAPSRARRTASARVAPSAWPRRALAPARRGGARARQRAARCRSFYGGDRYAEDEDDEGEGEGCGSEMCDGGPNGFDYNDDGPEVLESDDGFDYAFAAGTRDAVVRVLTARATQLVLLQEAELNAHACQWLHAFCADRPEGEGPTSGDKFVRALMGTSDDVVMDLLHGGQHEILPTELAERIMTTRKHLASQLCGMEVYVDGANTELKRNYITDTFEGGRDQPDARRQRGGQ